ncbi:hypothetical protein Gotur_032408 [Gossypium turneri]
MAPMKRSRTSASSCNPSSELESSFSTCFQVSHSRYIFNLYFASKRVWEARKINIAMLEAIIFAYLLILQNWRVDGFFKYFLTNLLKSCSSFLFKCQTRT